MEIYIGEVVHFFNKASVIVIKLEDVLALDDEIKIKRGDSEFTQKIDSMQINHENVDMAKSGEEVAIKVENSAKEGDKVYKIV